MEDHRGIGIHQIHSAAQAADKDHGKFQTLAFMDGHDPHRVRQLPIEADFPEIYFVPLHLLHIADKLKQPVVTGGFEVRRFLHQHIQIGLPLFSSGHGCRRGAVAGILQNIQDHLVNRRVGKRFPELFQSFQEPVQLCPQPLLFSLPGIDGRRLINGKIRAAAFDGCQFPFRHVPHGRVQGRREGNILSGIIADPQIIQHRGHFNGTEIPGFGRNAHGNSLLLQHSGKCLVPSGGLPQQNHAVPVPQGPQLSPLRHLHLSHQGTDFFCHGKGLRLHGRPLASVLLKVRRFPVQKQQFCFASPVLRIPGPVIQSRVPVILQPSQIPAHNPTEQIIDRVQHFPAASKVPAQIYALSRAVFFGIAEIFFQKDFRPCLTEAVNGLLHIPHHKPVAGSILLPGHSPQEIFLDIVAVLILIHHDFLKLSRQLPGCLCPADRLPLPLQQNFQGKMLQIGKIHKIFPAFSFAEGSHIRFCKADQLLREIPASRQLLQQGLGASGKIPASYVFDSGFKTVPPVLDPLLHLRIAVRLFPGKSLERQLLKGFIILPVRPLLFQFLQKLQIRFQHGKIFLRPPRAFRVFQELPGGFFQIPETPGRVLLQKPDKSRLFQVFLCFRPVIFQTALQPDFRPGIALGKFRRSLQQVLYAGVIFPGGAGLGKIQKLLTARGVFLLQKIPQHFLFQHSHFPVVPDPVTGIQINPVKIVLDHIGAEPVDGADSGMMQQSALPLEMFVVRIFQQPLFQCSADALLHLSRGGLGKSDYQQPVNVRGMPGIRHPGEDPLHQHRRLAGTGGSAYQNVSVPKADSLFLFFCPFVSHHSASSLICFRTSSSDFFRILRYSKPGSLWSNPQMPR